MTEKTTEPTVEETQATPEVEADPQGVPASDTAETKPVDDETAAEVQAWQEPEPGDPVEAEADTKLEEQPEPAPSETYAEPDNAGRRESEDLPEEFQTPAVKALLATFPDVSVKLNEVMGDGLVQVIVSRGDDTNRETRRRTVTQADALEGPILDLAGRMGAKVK